MPELSERTPVAVTASDLQFNLTGPVIADISWNRIEFSTKSSHGPSGVRKKRLRSAPNPRTCCGVFESIIDLADREIGEDITPRAWSGSGMLHIPVSMSFFCCILWR